MTMHPSLSVIQLSSDPSMTASKLGHLSALMSIPGMTVERHAQKMQAALEYIESENEPGLKALYCAHQLVPYGWRTPTNHLAAGQGFTAPEYDIVCAVYEDMFVSVKLAQNGVFTAIWEYEPQSTWLLNGQVASRQEIQGLDELLSSITAK
jgi:hypothetical protein